MILNLLADFASEEEMTEVIGKRLRAERKNAGLTQTQVAEKMGTRQSLVAKIEGGIQRPTFWLVTKFLKALGANGVALNYTDVSVIKEV